MTLTKEWLQQTIAELEEERDATPSAVNEDAAMALAAMKLALASLGAEPVGYFYADKPGDWYQISDGDRVPDHRRIPLYSSPQSGPVVKLPNEFMSNEGIVVQIEKVMAVLAVAGIRYERKGNACRAAMLQGAAGNSPAIPNGYALVPVEPTMAMLDEFDSIIDHGAEDSKDAWSRLLAAAPQQEVK
ncbi:hypothetical protein RKT74_13490 [Leclercia pneumoniae]|uniref:hypothetical protein n=1 Tax=Leclercia pneumoniae TaxID=2815358 RepID=UPI0021E58AE4|nr:hypothetical protein [Leclercia pneumoniae]MCV2510189.1 hypothetical protein [Leclercia pneumoniae]WNN79744.1 hypothetical protein RKT74_13490 [Leclercia pneumoniae]